MASKMEPKLPVIVFSKENLRPGTTSWLSTSNQVRCALEDYGIFIAVCAQIPLELHKSIFHLTTDLFDLPIETKAQNTSDKLGFGYGNNFSNMIIEYLGIEDAATLEATQSFTNLMWPQRHETFCETALLYSKLLSDLGQTVLRMVFDSYGVDEKRCESHIESVMYLLRFMKYQRNEINGDKFGLHPHTDKNFWTILDQNQVKGLEIETKDGEWISFEPSPSTFLFIAGEPFLAWSNGRIHPAFHKVTITGKETKYSIGLFAFVRGDVEVPAELVDEEHPLRFKPFNPLSYLQYCGKEGMKFKNPIIPYCGV